MSDLVAPGSPGFLLACLAAYLLLANLLAFAVFGADKRRAIRGGQRLSESYLLTVALAGGWAGAKLAQRRFRHKTQTQPFGRRLNRIGMLHLILAALLLTPLGGLMQAGVTRATAGLPTGAEFLTAARDALVPEREEERPALPRRFGPGS